MVMAAPVCMRASDRDERGEDQHRDRMTRGRTRSAHRRAERVAVRLALPETLEELLDVLAGVLGAFEDREADAREHLLEPRAHVTLADGPRALLDAPSGPIDLALVRGAGGSGEDGDRRQHDERETLVATHRCHVSPP